MRSGKSPTDFRDEVAGDAITLPEFWSANGACAFVLKSSRPSLPLKKAPPLISVFFNGLYTPFGSPVCGGQKPQEREDVAGDAIALPEFWSASGACARKGLAESAYATELRVFYAIKLRLFVA